MKQKTGLAALVLVAAVSAYADDWPMWGGNPTRNMVNTVEKNIPKSWDVETGKNIKWVSQLGSQTYGNPVVAGGKVFVGTNNGAARQPAVTGDKGIVMCFSEKDGTFLWQLTHDKLQAGRVNDWPHQGVCSTAAVDGDKLYYVSNRCELVCADVEGFRDGENDGPFKEETLTSEIDGDIVWKLDMINELGVFPHNLAASSPTYDEERVYLVTGNGVDEAHIVLPMPMAPSFLAVNKADGKVAWESNLPGENVLHGQWSSPVLGTMGGQKQAVFPGGDGRLYSFATESGELLWSFQCNPADAVWQLGGKGTRNNIIATPVIYGDNVYVGLGQDPEHGEGPGHLYSVDATKRGDVTDSAAVWHLDKYNRTLSSVAIHDGILYTADLSGYFYAIDVKTGKVLWQHDLLAAIWGSPMVIDGHVYLGDEDGDIIIFKTGKEKQIVFETSMGSSVYSTPVAANAVLFITSRNQLFAIAEGASSEMSKVK